MLEVLAIQRSRQSDGQRVVLQGGAGDLDSVDDNLRGRCIQCGEVGTTQDYLIRHSGVQHDSTVAIEDELVMVGEAGERDVHRRNLGDTLSVGELDAEVTVCLLDALVGRFENDEVAEVSTVRESSCEACIDRGVAGNHVVVVGDDELVGEVQVVVCVAAAVNPAESTDRSRLVVSEDTTYVLQALERDFVGEDEFGILQQGDGCVGDTDLGYTRLNVLNHRDIGQFVAVLPIGIVGDNSLGELCDGGLVVDGEVTHGDVGFCHRDTCGDVHLDGVDGATGDLVGSDDAGTGLEVIAGQGVRSGTGVDGDELVEERLSLRDVLPTLAERLLEDAVVGDDVRPSDASRHLEGRLLVNTGNLGGCDSSVGLETEFAKHGGFDLADETAVDFTHNSKGFRFVNYDCLIHASGWRPMAVAIDGSREGDEVAAILISERRAKVERRSSGG